MTQLTLLPVTTSRARGTAGWSIVRLRDEDTGKIHRCMGGNYDMRGTVFGRWLEDVHQDLLLAIKDQAGSWWDPAAEPRRRDVGPLYGMAYLVDDDKVLLDGAAGLSSMERIAKAAGLVVESLYDLSSRRQGLIGWRVHRPEPFEAVQAEIHEALEQYGIYMPLDLRSRLHDRLWDAANAEQRAQIRQEFTASGWKSCSHEQCPPHNCRR